MKTPRYGWDKYVKISTRVTVIILGVLLVTGMLLLPAFASSAHLINQIKFDPYLPIVLVNANFGPTHTNTPTNTPTVSGTPPTLTATNTVGPSPTHTLTPSPTFTGTLTPNAALTVSVTPSQAKVNETFTFTIKVGNTGNGPTTSNLIADSFPTYIDVVTVTSTKGTVTKLSHSFTVALGDVHPGEVVTITALVRVNSSLTRTETQSNVVTLNYNETQTKTASASYKVVYQTLPGTGELPLNWRERRLTPPTVIPGLVCAVVGGIMLILSAWWSMVKVSRYRLWMMVGGALLIFIGFFIGLTAFGIIKPVKQVKVYEMTPTSGIMAGGQAAMPSETLEHRPASAFSTPDSIIPIVPQATLPDYPIPTPVITITPQPGEPRPDISAITRIVIPALILDTEVKYVPYDGFTWLITGLQQEVAWMGNTSWPGLGSNTALAGHITVAGMGDGPFRHLDELPAGEVVLLYTEKNIYTYKVRESKVTDGGDMTVTLPSDNPQISLITCVDWNDELHEYSNRLVVIADLVDTNPIAIGMTP